jgi:hypothetical protein
MDSYKTKYLIKLNNVQQMYKFYHYSANHESYQLDWNTTFANSALPVFLKEL